AHLLIARALYRREIPGHLPVFILLDLEHLGPAGAHPIHQFAHAVGVGRHARLHLIVQRPVPLHLLLHDLAPPRAETLLAGAQLRRLILRQLQVVLHARAEALLDLRAQPLRFGRIAALLQAVALLGGKPPPPPPPPLPAAQPEDSRPLSTYLLAPERPAPPPLVLSSAIGAARW